MTLRDDRPLPPLPFSPPDDSLAGVVLHLKSAYSHDGSLRPRNADEPAVRWLLEGGVKALSKKFCSFGGHDAQAYASANEILGSVPLDEVMKGFAEVLAERTEIALTKPSRERILHRWDTATRFQRDLINYIFRPGFHAARMKDFAIVLLSKDLSFGEMVTEVAKHETEVVPREPLLQLQQALRAGFPADKEIQTLAAARYEQQAEEWGKLYEFVCSAYGVEIDPGVNVTFVDMAHIFNVVVEGAYLRSTARPSLVLLHSGRHLAVETIQMLIAHAAQRPWSVLENARVNYS